MKNYDTLSEAINDLKQRGYSYDFNLKPSCLECASLKIEIKPEDFKVDETHRFEGMSSTDDNIAYCMPYHLKMVLRALWWMPMGSMQKTFLKQ